MAEVVGAVASVLALCQAVSVGAKRLIDLYHAPAEVADLQVSTAIVSFGVPRWAYSE
jgi:hypothetical protein